MFQDYLSHVLKELHGLAGCMPFSHALIAALWLTKSGSRPFRSMPQSTFKASSGCMPFPHALIAA